MIWKAEDAQGAIIDAVGCEPGILVHMPHNRDGWLIQGSLWEGGPITRIFISRAEVLKQRSKEHLSCLVKAKVLLEKKQFEDEFPNGVPEDKKHCIFLRGIEAQLL